MVMVPDSITYAPRVGLSSEIVMLAPGRSSPRDISIVAGVVGNS
jgi:hypothetical protein